MSPLVFLSLIKICHSCAWFYLSINIFRSAQATWRSCYTSGDWYSHLILEFLVIKLTTAPVSLNCACLQYQYMWIFLRSTFFFNMITTAPSPIVIIGPICCLQYLWVVNDVSMYHLTSLRSQTHRMRVRCTLPHIYFGIIFHLP